LKKAEHDNAHKNATLKISNLEKERESLIETNKAFNDKFKLMIDDKAKNHAEACTPLDEEWKSYNRKIEDIVEKLTKIEVKIKTQDALNKREVAEKMAKATKQEKEARASLVDLQSRLEDLRRKIELQNRTNSALNRDVEGLQATYQVADESDEEICSRKYSTPTSSSMRGKRKMADDLEIDIFNHSSDDMDTNADELKTPKASTPINKSILKINPSTISFSRKSALANIVKNKGNEKTSKSSDNSKKPTARSKKVKDKTLPTNITKKVEVKSSSDDDVFDILSLTTSQE